MKTIEIIISPGSESRVETKGFAGSACRDASRFLELALGKATSESLTAEFHEAYTHDQNHLEQEK
ncbi:hypothetical protein Pan97_16760 [Bremerella volcania]|uniref:DUF2997 domain-containing protein n=1 Tax=Bremerella volcania TaxID=2527984 RepID=A0A518C631_9BACT|nr:DUF2997 domain-containing protein [Bremerella volcania]QDU74664.1 hypothetical protein Pan97_16760 [Bremerella volcania]